MAVPYSTQLLVLQGLTPSLGELAFAAPPGLIAIVRDINVYNETGVGTESDLWFKNFDIGNTLYRWTNNGPGTLLGFFTGRQVFPTGQHFGLVSTAGAWDVQMSGYLLSTTP